jgi:hypothetical protein
MGVNKQVLGLGFTFKQRKTRALQDTVMRTGADPNDLTYAEHTESKTSTVTDRTGKVLGRFGW